MSWRALSEPIGQGWPQVVEFAVAFVLSAAIGLEREVRNKSAGVRTYTVVGIGSALFMLISKYGFTDVLGPNITLDPSRVAAQIVSGLGFIGAGIIFVKRDSVRGLTTAASIWLTAAIGAAAGAGLLLLAVLGTIGHFATVLVLPRLASTVTRRIGPRFSVLRVRYVDGRGLLRDALAQITRAGFVVTEVATSRVEEQDGTPTVEVVVHVEGKGDLDSTVVALTEMPSVLSVSAGDEEE